MPASPLRSFRLAFAGIWLVYDVFDLTGSGTAQINDWSSAAAPAGLVELQTGLIACELALLLLGGRWILPVGALAAVLRALEWDTYLRLNDFAYFIVTMAIVANTRGEGLLPRRSSSPNAPLVPAWPRDVLLWQAGWMYLATGVLKLNPSWLSGGHLWVRFQYLAALGWPYPGLVRRCTESLGCDRVLSLFGVLGELTLAGLLLFRPQRRLALPVAIAVHGFAMVMTNVWFFGPSLIAEVGFLTNGPRARATVPPS
jgi:hypothetical protein